MTSLRSLDFCAYINPFRWEAPQTNVCPRPTPSSQTRASGPQFHSRGGADGSGSRSVPEGRCAGESRPRQRATAVVESVGGHGLGWHTPTVSFYRILPGKSTDEGRQVLGGHSGTVVVDGFALYEVLARNGLGLVLAHCWAHTKRKYEDIADQWPIACAESARSLVSSTRSNVSCRGHLQTMPRQSGPRAYLLCAVYAAIGRPGTVTFPEDLLASTLTG